MGKNERDDPIMAAFVARLRELRLAQGMTAEQLAAAVDPPILRESVARYEGGGRVPSWVAVVRLAMALGVTPNDFLPPVKKPKGKK